ncbi:probable WRKY transcription factor 14 [Oryza brachyantha]|uniref:probable WRKY transcription factor 14 n=1 Tax=Oryza brachyantha TaxID=4533 RepID=UPI001ADBB10A|nr:probable WRKY transcription factor 14 [Oryza brachyantha]
MCDYFLQRMEGDQAGGDLTDIVRAGGGAMPGSVVVDLPSTAAEWQLPAEPMLFPPPPSLSSDGCGGAAEAANIFGGGDPFAGLADPFSSDYSSGADFLDAMPDAMAKVGFDTVVGAGAGGGGGGGGGGGNCGQLLDMSRKPLLPRGMPMPAVGALAPPRVMPSPLSPRAIRPYPAISAGDMMKLGITAGQAAGCAIDAAVAGMQMSSPRSGGIKRRKNQARKVVCIPAPTAAGGRPSGEVVPSDLWAWRKYGQKPIKGSPYPRGYYRCSSSKGCSARKQVERSRTDPNMLVITYTSEHNHPWPTQRNALAGSTRSHHSKNSGGGGGGGSGSKSSQNEKSQQANVKEEQKDQAATTATSTITTTNSASPVVVKEEETLAGSSSEALELERVMDTAAGVVDHSELMDHVFSESYKPMIPETGQPDDFFADLAELESDPMSLIFSKEYMEAKPPGGGDHAQEKAMAKDLDPFDMIDWSTTANSSVGSSFEQGKRG